MGRCQEGDSLIIFDEVQLFPKARAAIKYLVQDGRFDYIETGSLMSVRKNVQDILIPSEERAVPLYPLDVEEFFWATGNTMLYTFIQDAYCSKRPVGDAMHRKLMDAFRQYIVVGGMPQAVKKYCDGGSFGEADSVKRDILTLYRRDIAKHAAGYAAKVEAIFDEIPAQLTRHEKKFRLSSLKKGARFRDYEDALFWLTDARIINPCYAAEPSVGLRMNLDQARFKCYMGDTGLLISHAFDARAVIDENLYSKLLLGKLESNEGMIFENAAAQMLKAGGRHLYYYSNASRDNKDDRMEVDFLITRRETTNRHNILPIEVKSSKNYRLSSLNKFRNKFRQQTCTTYVLHTGDYREKDGIAFLPAYMTPLLAAYRENGSPSVL